MTTFNQYMLDTYSVEELGEIAEHGCESGCATTLIYYHDTNTIYDKYCEELHEMLGEWQDEMGLAPEYVFKHIGNSVTFKNAVVWFCAEIIANRAYA